MCTGGELEVALAAGVAPASLGFTATTSRVAELERAVALGVGTIVVDSAIEIERLAPSPPAPTPCSASWSGSSAASTPRPTTSSPRARGQKFGFPLAEAEVAVARIREIPGLEFAGLHCHIGSQIFGVAGFRESASRVLELHAALLEDGPCRS
ncbi:hypothetical protein AB1285_23580 [Microbacterium sp. NRRL B-14842]|uniref:hypothetical protein n=1 Tax=Microbacterium sp. NRRL B-14842 TaxID=3162881 RepID=UPI003D2D7668